MLAAGPASLKIEGRMKSAYYVANITRVYRQALDACWQAYEQACAQLAPGEEPTAEQIRALWQWDDEWAAELEKLSQRQYFTGFALADAADLSLPTQNAPGPEAYDYENSYSQRNWDFAGLVLGWDAEQQRLHIEQRNHLQLGDELELIQPQGPLRRLKIEAIWDEQGQARQTLPYAREHAWLACPFAMPAGSILRRRQRPVQTAEAEVKADE